MLSCVLRPLIFIQGSIATVFAQVYMEVGNGFCRDGNGLHPNVYCRDLYAVTACQARCNADFACVAFQIGTDSNVSCCIYGSATDGTAPPDWDFGYGNGGTDDITQAVSSDRVCFKKVSCGSNEDCDIALGSGYECQDSHCRDLTTVTSDATILNNWSLLAALRAIAITIFCIGLGPA